MVSGISIVENTPDSMNKANISRLESKISLVLEGQGRRKRHLHVLHKLIWPSNVFQTSEPYLRNDCANLTRSGRNTNCRAPVTSRKRLPRRQADRRVWPKVREKVAQAVQEDKDTPPVGACVHLVVRKAHDNEERGEHREAHRLDRFASPAVDGKYAGVRAGDLACNGQDKVPDADVAQVLIYGGCACEVWRRRAEADGVEDDGGVESKAVERDLQLQLVREWIFMYGSRLTSIANQLQHVPIKTFIFFH